VGDEHRAGAPRTAASSRGDLVGDWMTPSVCTIDGHPGERILNRLCQ